MNKRVSLSQEDMYLIEVALIYLHGDSIYG